MSRSVKITVGSVLAIAGLAATLFATGALDALWWRYQSRILSRDLDVVERRTAERARKAYDEATRLEVPAFWLTEVGVVLDRHAAMAPPRGVAAIAITQAVVSDLRATLDKAGEMRASTEHLLDKDLASMAGPENYAATTASLAGVREWIEQAPEKVKTAEEAHRLRIAGSGLGFDMRVELWQSLRPVYVLLHDGAEQARRQYLGPIRGLQAAVEFLHEHPGTYRTGPDGKLLFTDPGPMFDFRRAVSEAQRPTP